MARFNGHGDIGTTYIYGKEISKSNEILDFKGELLDLLNSINILMLANPLRSNIELKLELTRVMETLKLIFDEVGLSKDKCEYRISEVKYLEENIKKYDLKLNGKEKTNLLSCKEGCLVQDCFIKTLKLERTFYKLNIEALYSTYLNRLSTYFKVLKEYIDEENGF